MKDAKKSKKQIAKELAVSVFMLSLIGSAMTFFVLVGNCSQ